MDLRSSCSGPSLSTANGLVSASSDGDTQISTSLKDMFSDMPLLATTCSEYNREKANALKRKGHQRKEKNNWLNASTQIGQPEAFCSHPSTDENPPSCKRNCQKLCLDQQSHKRLHVEQQNQPPQGNTPLAVDMRNKSIEVIKEALKDPQLSPAAQLLLKSMDMISMSSGCTSSNSLRGDNLSSSGTSLRWDPQKSGKKHITHIAS